MLVKRQCISPSTKAVIFYSHHRIGEFIYPNPSATAHLNVSTSITDLKFKKMIQINCTMKICRNEKLCI